MQARFEQAHTQTAQLLVSGHGVPPVNRLPASLLLPQLLPVASPCRTPRLAHPAFLPAAPSPSAPQGWPGNSQRAAAAPRGPAPAACEVGHGHRGNRVRQAHVSKSKGAFGFDGNRAAAAVCGEPCTAACRRRTRARRAMPGRRRHAVVGSCTPAGTLAGKQPCQGCSDLLRKRGTSPISLSSSRPTPEGAPSGLERYPSRSTAA